MEDKRITVAGRQASVERSPFPQTSHPRGTPTRTYGVKLPISLCVTFGTDDLGGYGVKMYGFPREMSTDVRLLFSVIAR